MLKKNIYLSIEEGSIEEVKDIILTKFIHIAKIDWAIN